VVDYQWYRALGATAVYWAKMTNLAMLRGGAFLAATTFGPATEADKAVARVRSVHRRVQGVSRDGRPYSAGDPHLLRWVHVAEVDSFLQSHQHYGAERLSDEDASGYVADMARIARGLGVPDPPTDLESLRLQLRAYRPELTSTPEARAAARFLFVPPLPLVARAPYAVLFGAAVSLLPWRARLSLGLPPVTPASDALVRPAATALVGVLRWALSADARPAGS